MLENIIIQKADKGNVIVLINKNYHVRKYHALYKKRISVT